MRKIETLTCRGHCRTVPTDHHYIVTLGDEFISPKRIIFLSARQGPIWLSCPIPHVRNAEAQRKKCEKCYYERTL